MTGSVQQKAGVEGPWLYDRRVRWLLELTIDEDEHVRFGIEGARLPSQREP
jgi:hypothetical protein